MGTRILVNIHALLSFHYLKFASRVSVVQNLDTRVAKYCPLCMLSFITPDCFSSNQQCDKELEQFMLHMDGLHSVCIKIITNYMTKVEI